MANSPFRVIVRSAPLLNDTVKHIPQSIGFAIAELKKIPCALSEPFPQNTAVIITSANVIPFIPHHIPVITVNHTTQERAENKGLNVVKCGHGNAQDLAEELIRVQLPYTHFIHMHGDKADITWHQLLIQAGYTIDSQVIYLTHYAEHIPDNVLTALKNNGITEIFLFSSKGAQQCKHLFRKHSIPTNNFTAYCLSEAIAAEWTNVKRTIIAPQPTLKSLIDQIESAALS